MYRHTILLFIAAAAAAPQDNSITYIKMLPQPEETAPSYRSSRIENLPLTIGSQLDNLGSQLDNQGSQLDNLGSQLDNQGSQLYNQGSHLDNLASEISEDKSRTETTDSTEDSTIDDSSETTEATTEKYELKTTPGTKKPKFISKLSYFEKPSYNSVLTNLVERAGKRRFKSKCRCEKISNCPKLQITVPRCPEEMFLCCF